MISFGDLTSEWEWFVALGLQKKPVELVDIPDAAHLLERPRQRYVAMQGLVDWFRFWLQDYEDPDPAKKAQSLRWEHLRELRNADAQAGQEASSTR